MDRDGYSLMRGGPLFRTWRALSGKGSEGFPAAGIALLAVLLAVVPLAASCALNGTLTGSRVDIPLAADFSFLARFLLVVPLLVILAPWADARVRRELRQLHALPIVRRGRTAELERLMAGVRRLRDATTPEVVCLVLAILPTLVGTPSMEVLAGSSNWRADADGSANFATHWFNLVSMPMFRFVAALWLWRLCLWVVLLARLSKLDLVLRPTHPDGAGGIGFLGNAQQRFAPLALAGGLLMGGEAANQMIHLDRGLLDLKYLLLSYIAGATLLLAIPPFMLMPAMARVKRESLRKYDALAYRMGAEFDRRWRKTRPADDSESLLDDDDASALADYGAVYETAKRMSTTPLSRNNLLVIVLFAAIPMLPLVFLEIPLLQLLKRIMSTLA